MLYVKFSPSGLPLVVSNEVPDFTKGDGWESRWDWSSFQRVETIARYLTASTGKLYVAVDNGAGCAPRYDVMEAPQVGDEVSYAFNGDSYPDGTIVRITRKLTVTTSTGHTYRRKGNTSGWYQPGGTWGMVHGHHYTQNPHF